MKSNNPPVYRGMRKCWRAGNSRVMSLPPGPLCRYAVYEGADGCYVLIPEEHKTDIIEVD